MKRNIRFFVFAIAISAFSSCGIYSKFSSPEVEDKELAGAQIELPDTAAVPVPSWKEFFTDLRLQSLIEEGLDSNSDLRIAELNIQQAERVLGTSKMAFLPSLVLAPNASIGGVGSASSALNYSVPLQASWELDIFGKLRNSKEKSRASLLQSQEYTQMVKTQIISGIASAYYTLILLDTQLEISQASMKLAEETLESIKTLKEVGLQNEAAVLQASANLKSISLSVMELEKSISEAESSLCLLLNKAPQKIERGDALSLEFELEESISLAALSNRPDVRVAEMNLRQSFYGVNYARSALYPSITLSGSAGWANNAGGAILNPADFVFSALASLTQPIFMAGVNRANLEIAKSQYDQQLISFEKSLLSAGKEVNDALIECEVAKQSSVILSAQVDELSKAVNITKELMEGGKANYLEVLTAQSNLLSSELNEAVNLYNYSIGGINLYKSIGGGRE